MKPSKGPGRPFGPPISCTIEELTAEDLALIVAQPHAGGRPLADPDDRALMLKASKDRPAGMTMVGFVRTWLKRPAKCPLNGDDKAVSKRVRWLRSHSREL
jgi:hypothetical protein